MGGVPELPWGPQAHRRRGGGAVKEAGGEDSSWLGGCSLEEPRHAATGGSGAGGGAPGRTGVESECKRRGKRRRPLERAWGQGRRRRLGVGPWTSGPRPRHLLSLWISPGCLALGAERSWCGRACWAGVPRLSDRWGHERSWRSTAGNLEDRANDGKQASDSGTWCSAFCKCRF